MRRKTKRWRKPLRERSRELSRPYIVNININILQLLFYWLDNNLSIIYWSFIFSILLIEEGTEFKQTWGRRTNIIQKDSIVQDFCWLMIQSSREYEKEKSHQQSRCKKKANWASGCLWKLTWTVLKAINKTQKEVPRWTILRSEDLDRSGEPISGWSSGVASWSTILPTKKGKQVAFKDRQSSITFGSGGSVWLQFGKEINWLSWLPFNWKVELLIP